jgi:hypothetical protein
VKKLLLLLATHAVALALGVALGIYLLPILIAPASPANTDVAAQASSALFQGTFRRDLKDSDALHWGEGVVSIGSSSIGLRGRLAPGPDYKLYLSPEFVETEADFMRLKSRMVRVADIKTFDNFLVAVPPGVDVARFNTVVVWCETFSQFITAAKYQ